MSQWVNRLDLKDLWNLREEEKITIQEMGKKIAERIKKMKCYKDEEETLEPIVDGFECMDEDVEEFDYILAELYDWGDQLVEKGKTWSMDKKMCWIATRF